MIRTRFPQSAPGQILLVLVLVLVANGVVVRCVSRPLQAVRAKAEELHGGAGQLHLRSGGYSAGILGMTAHGSFVSGEGKDARLLEVELSRPFAFAPWRLESFRAVPLGE